MSPLVWDLAHIGNFEELWLLREITGAAAIDPALDDIYDAFRHPRPNRPALPLLGPAEARRYLAEVRGRVVDTLETVDVDGGDRARPLLAGGYVYGMVVQHEHQHDETMLATLQLMDDPGYRPIAPTPPAGSPVGGDIHVPAGPFVMGTDDEFWAYDNERPAHIVDLPAFHIDAAPVTNRDYADLRGRWRIPASRLWTPEGWAWREKADLRAPEFWTARGRRPVVTAAVRLARGPPARRAGPARVLARGRRLRPLGGQAPAHRSGVGEGGIVVAGRQGALAVGRRRPQPRPGQRRRQRVSAPRRWAPTRPAPPRWAATR